MDQMIKSTKSVIHKMILIQKRIRTLEKTNRTINKRRKAKKTRIQQREVLNIQNANTLLNAKEMDTQLEKEIHASDCSRGGGRTTMRRYGNCGEPRYNTRIYKKNKEMSNIYSSD